MSQHSILDGIRVASPCQASWDGMTGDDRRRACRACGKDVYNLSEMTTAEALALVSRPGPRPCVRFYRRSDGTVLTSDCPVGARATRKRWVRRAAGLGLGLSVMSAVAWAFGFGRSPEPRDLTPPFPGSATPTPPGLKATVSGWVDQTLSAVGFRRGGHTVGEADAILVPPTPPASPIGSKGGQTK